MLPNLEVFGLNISTYFLVISLSTLISCLWFIRRTEARGFNRVIAIDFTLVVLVSGFLGARLLHVVYEEPEFYLSSPWSVLAFWNGGFVYLGGLVAAVTGAYAFCVVKKEPFWFWADLAAAPIALGYSLGRLACFLNGCCFGKYCELPWAIHLHGTTRHPVQLYAFFWELMLVGVILLLERRNKVAGRVFNLWLILHGIGRIGMEAFRDDPRGDLMGGLTLGVWMSVTLIGIALFNLVSGLQILKKE